MRCHAFFSPLKEINLQLQMQRDNVCSPGQCQKPLPEAAHTQGGRQGWWQPGPPETRGLQHRVQAGGGTHLTTLGGWTRSRGMDAAANPSLEEAAQIPSWGSLVS